jgi:hypothetical protein
VSGYPGPYNPKHQTDAALRPTTNLLRMQKNHNRISALLKTHILESSGLINCAGGKRINMWTKKSKMNVAGANEINLTMIYWLYASFWVIRRRLDFMI